MTADTDRSTYNGIVVGRDISNYDMFKSISDKRKRGDALTNDDVDFLIDFRHTVSTKEVRKRYGYRKCRGSDHCGSCGHSRWVKDRYGIPKLRCRTCQGQTGSVHGNIPSNDNGVVVDDCHVCDLYSKT